MICNIPRYLMDNESFYLNPEFPELGLKLSSSEELTVEEIRRVRIPVKIFREGRLVEPTGKIPVEILQSTKILKNV